MRYLEILAFVFGLIQSLLVMLNKKENWIFYNLYIISLLILSWSFKLYGDVAENVVYLILGVFGTVHWYRGSNKADSTLPGYGTKIELILSGAALFALFFVLYIFLIKTNDPLPFLDSLTTVLGFVATYLMAKRRIETWVVWLVDDILMVVVYFLIPEQPVYLLMLNIVWSAFAVMSFIKWHGLSILNTTGTEEK